MIFQDKAARDAQASSPSTLMPVWAVTMMRWCQAHGITFNWNPQRETVTLVSRCGQHTYAFTAWEAGLPTMPWNNK